MRKKVWKASVLGAVILLLLTACGKSTYQKGSLTENGWSSEWLGMTFDAPEGCYVFSEEEAAGLVPLSEEEAQITVPELVVNLSKEDGTATNMQVWVINDRSVSKDMISNIDQTMKELTVADGAEVDYSGFDGTRSIGGTDFQDYRVHFYMNGFEDGLEVHCYWTEKDGCLVYMQIMTFDSEAADIDTLINGFSAL